MAISNNLELYDHLKALPAEQMRAEYARLVPTLGFKAYPLDLLLVKGARYDKLLRAGGAKNVSNG